jgi:hypothetical protein
MRYKTKIKMKFNAADDFLKQQLQQRVEMKNITARRK